MNLPQLHYTSAPSGPDTAGFRFTACSAGVPEAVRSEAARLIGYEPPKAAPATPSGPELAAFPRAFTHTELADGSRLLSHTVCTGFDHNGRLRNFHAHAVLVPKGARLPGDALPVTAWDSPAWAVHTPADPVPEPLAALPASRFFAGDSMPDFAARRADRLPAFFAALRAVVLDPAAPRVVLVEEDCATVARWIALASSVLGHAQARALTFTTYTRRPRQAPQQLIGVLPDDAPPQDEPAAEPGYRVLDARRPAEITDDVWARTAAEIWARGEPRLFREALALPGGPCAPGPLAATALAAGLRLDTAARTAAADWAAEHPGVLEGEWAERLVTGLSAPPADSTTAPAPAAAPGPATAAVAPAATTAPADRAAPTSSAAAPAPTAPAPAQTEAATEAAAQTAAKSEAATTTEAETTRPTRPDRELAALRALHKRLGSRAPARVMAPLAALLLTETVRSGAWDVPALPDDLPEPTRARLAAELGDELLAGIEGAAPRDLPRAVGLLRLASTLDIDCAGHFPRVAQWLSRALIAERGSGWTAALGEVLEREPALRTALLAGLDEQAAEDPPAAARLFDDVTLPLSDQRPLPHLRMCAAAHAAGPDQEDRVAALHGLLRAAGTSMYDEPLLMRTAVRLTWGDEPPDPREGARLLAETGSDVHRTAGTWKELVAAALTGDPELAGQVLISYAEDVTPSEKAALTLLRHTATAEPGPARTAQALTLAEAARPHEAAVQRAFATLAEALLSPDVPDAELRTLINTADDRLTTAYREAAAAPEVTDRVTKDPHYAARCYEIWSSCPQAGPPWSPTGAALLAQVLRPALAALPHPARAEAESHLRAHSADLADAFHHWLRPPPLTRLAHRLTARRRKPA